MALVWIFVSYSVCYSMGLTLHQHSHSHGGVGSHSHEASGQNNANINVRAAYIHVLGDIIQSLGVLVAAIIVYIKVSNLRVNRYVSGSTSDELNMGNSTVLCWTWPWYLLNVMVTNDKIDIIKTRNSSSPLDYKIFFSVIFLLSRLSVFYLLKLGFLKKKFNL